MQLAFQLAEGQNSHDPLEPAEIRASEREAASNRAHFLQSAGAGSGL